MYGSKDGLWGTTGLLLIMNFTVIVVLVILGFAGIGVTVFDAHGTASVGGHTLNPILGTAYAALLFLIGAVVSSRMALLLIALIFYHLEQYVISLLVLICLTVLLIVEIVPLVDVYILHPGQHTHAAQHPGSKLVTQDKPSPGLLMPGAATLPAGFTIRSRTDIYTKYSYNSVSQLDPPGTTLTLRENFEKNYLAASDEKRPVTQAFMFQNMPGDILYTPGQSGETGNYTLHWSDSGTDLVLMLENVPKGKTTLQGVIDLLGTLECVPGDSIKAELAPPTGVLAPTMTSVPSGFQLYWQEYNATDYTMEYRSGPRVLVYHESADKNGQGTYDNQAAGIKYLDATAKWPKPEDADKPYMRVTQESDPSRGKGSSRIVRTPMPVTEADFKYNGAPGKITIGHMQSGGSVIHVVWNDNGSAVVLALYNFSSDLSSSTIINLLGTLQRVQ